ncbi:MAG: hypothetical protein U0842_13100 [Candidatus Binatia bacterium]
MNDLGRKHASSLIGSSLRKITAQSQLAAELTPLAEMAIRNHTPARENSHEWHDRYQKKSATEKPLRPSG